MKRAIIFSFLLLLGASCSREADCIQASGDRILQSRAVSPFSTVDVGLSASVYFEVDTSLTLPLVDVVAQSNIQDEISTTVTDSVLMLKFTGCIEKHEVIRITVKTPAIETIVLSGPGAIRSTEKISQEKLTVLSNASGDCDLLVELNELNVQSFGAGELRFAGYTGRADVVLTTSADFYGFELATDTAMLSIISSGNAQVRVQHILTAGITGSGDVFYKGAPIINRSGSGSGEIKNAN
jgi:hypothetical protein